jgi:chromosome segregation ATPase
MRNYERKTHEQEGFINNLNTEMERLNIIVKSKHQELDDYKLKYTRMESALQEYRHTESQNRDYENKINMLTQELERVNNVVRGKNQDLERATLTIRNIEEEMLYLRGYETKIAESEKTIITLNQTVDNIKREGTKWEDKIRTTESRCRELEQNCYAISQ